MSRYPYNSPDLFHLRVHSPWFLLSYFASAVTWKNCSHDGRYLHDTVQHLRGCLRKDKERFSAFNAIGLIAVAVKEDIKPYLPSILDDIRSALPSKVSTRFISWFLTINCVYIVRCDVVPFSPFFLGKSVEEKVHGGFFCVHMYIVACQSRTHYDCRWCEGTFGANACRWLESVVDGFPSGNRESCESLRCFLTISIIIVGFV
jgi:hypothetical protein